MSKKKAIWVIFGILVISGWVLGAAIQAEAETLNYKLYTWVIKSENVSVADMEGHDVFLQTRGSVLVFENGEVASADSFISGDLIKWKGAFTQYSTIKFQDNSMIMTKTQGVVGGSAADWKSEITKGTGRFTGIKGTASVKVKYLAIEKGEAGPRGYGEGTLIYTLPAK